MERRREAEGRVRQGVRDRLRRGEARGQTGAGQGRDRSLLHGQGRLRLRDPAALAGPLVHGQGARSTTGDGRHAPGRGRVSPLHGRGGRAHRRAARSPRGPAPPAGLGPEAANRRAVTVTSPSASPPADTVPVIDASALLAGTPPPPTSPPPLPPSRPPTRSSP